MSELETRSTGGAIVAAGSGVMDLVTYAVVRAQLAFAGMRLRGLSEQIRGTYRYVEGCADSVDRLADQMSGLQQEADTTAEHHQAAAVMRGVLARAEAMASASEDLAALFDQAATAHEADYGPVADAIRNSPVPMADASFYSNR